MFKATKLIEQEFNENDIKCKAIDEERFSAVKVAFNGSNLAPIQVNLISTDDDMGVKVFSGSFARVPEDKRGEMAVALNGLNRKYKYAKFAMDDKGDVRVQYVFPAATAEGLVGKFAGEITARFAEIVDDAYPEIMRAIYA